MSITGWTGEPDGMPVTRTLLGLAERGPGDTLALAAARSYDRPAEPPDPDERAANLIAGGYAPGHLRDLAQRLADTEADLRAQQEGNERAERQQARIQREHGAGRITAWDIMATDSPAPDYARAEQLQRRADRLRGQLAAAGETAARSRQRDADPVEAASRQAHQAFVEVTRARMADAAAGVSRPRQRRPFASRSRGGGDAPDCAECAKAGATVDESFLIHSDPWPPDPDAPPAAGDNEAAVYRQMPYCRGCGALRDWCKCGPVRL
jgi:hypothetical protein